MITDNYALIAVYLACTMHGFCHQLIMVLLVSEIMHDLYM